MIANSPPSVSDQALAWLTRLHSGHATPKDRRDAARWRAASPGHEAAFREAEMLWRMASDLAADPVTHRVISPASTAARPPRRSRMIALAALAASVLLLLAVGGWPPDVFADHATAADLKSLALDDGSLLRLDARTAVDVRYQPGERRILLHRGTAFFQVAPGVLRPFSVSAGAVTVTALGTGFEVAREPDGPVRVTVVEHSVSVAWPGGKGLVVHEGESVRLDGMGVVTPIHAVPMESVAAWRRNRMVAEGETLAQVVNTLSAHSRGWIVIADSRVAGLAVNAVLDLDDSPGSLRALESALPLRIHRLGDMVTVITSAD